MVADCGGFDAEAIVDFDIRSEGIVAFRVRGSNECIRSSSGEGSGDVVVTACEDERVCICVVKSIHERSEVRRGLGSKQSGLSIGEVEELHGEGRGRREFKDAQRVAHLAGHKHERAAAGAVSLGDDDDAFGIEVAVADKRRDISRSERVGDIKHKREV